MTAADVGAALGAITSKDLNPSGVEAHQPDGYDDKRRKVTFLGKWRMQDLSPGSLFPDPTLNVRSRTAVLLERQRGGTLLDLTCQ